MGRYAGFENCFWDRYLHEMRCMKDWLVMGMVMRMG